MSSTINFMDHVLQPKIVCSAPSLDGYEAENLAGKHNSFRNGGKGFKAETFVKPPMNITISFPVNIDIHQINIGCNNGSHTACGMEIFSRSDKWLEADCWIIPGTESSATGNHAKGDEALSPVGKGFSDANDFSFINYSFVPRLPFSTWRRRNYGQTQDSSAKKFNLKHWQRSHLNNVKQICVRLLRAKQYLCGIKYLEIWGQPAFECGKKREVVNLLKEKLFVPLVSEPSVCKQSSQTVPVTISDSEEELNDVPEEFLDRLTNAIMRQPMLLPSGVNVDKSSLEKYFESEAKWGRSQSDPFTGMTFRYDRKPVFNAALKMRIDHFLMNDNQQKHGIAIVGSTTKHQEQVSSLVEQPVTPANNVSVYETTQGVGKTASKGSYHTSNSNPSCMQNVIPVDLTDNEGKEKRFPNSQQKSSKRSLDTCSVNTNREVTTNKQATSSHKQSQDSTNSPTNKKMKVETKTSANDSSSLASHSSSLKSSLDFALSSVLEPGPSGRTVSLEPEPETKCGDCGVVSGLYRLECKHHLCRPCILVIKKRENICPICLVKINVRLVVKIHT